MAKKKAVNVAATKSEGSGSAIRMLGKHVLVRIGNGSPFEPLNQTSMIIRVETAGRNLMNCWGWVLAVGPEVTKVKAGDRAVFAAANGFLVPPATGDNSEYRIIVEDVISGVLE